MSTPSPSLINVERQGSAGGQRRTAHTELRSFYGLPETGISEESAAGGVQGAGGAVDINGANFDKDVYLSKLLRERSLTELMDKESEMVRNIKMLDSDMQTLVYENYNKFISATDTIRKMKTDFKKMEDEMDLLAANISTITDCSAYISDTLHGHRQQILKLSGVHTLLKKLQFLFELPLRLQRCMEQQAYSQAVRYYIKSQKVLREYSHMASLQGIQVDCQQIVQQLTARLREQLRQKDSGARQLAESVDLLLQLSEPADELCDEFLAHARHKLADDLELLQTELKLCGVSNPNETSSTLMDVLEFIDCGCNGFLSNICLVIASYSDMFLNRAQQNDQLDAVALRKLVLFVNQLMENYFDSVQQRIQLERATGDNTILVRALDRFHRRLQAMNKLLPDTDFSRAGTEIVSKAAKDRVGHYMLGLQQHLTDCLTDVRQCLAAPRLVNAGVGASVAGSQDKRSGAPSDLGEMLRKLHSSLIDQLKCVLANLQAFIAPEITFAMKPFFRNTFCTRDVRENLIVAFIRHIISISQEFCDGSVEDKAAVPAPVLLLMSRLCYDLDQSMIGYLLTLVGEQFAVVERHVDVPPMMTSASELCAAARHTAQMLLSHYVRIQGLTVSQMLRKSVETRDCLSVVEPRSVRAVMKRVVEDVTLIDTLVGQLYEEGVRTERTSDSTRRSLFSLQQQRGSAALPPGGTRSASQWSATQSTIDASLLSNIQKLFSEKIEVFSKVEFSRVSVLTGIIKISLKTFLECVRLRTFGRYGLQQIQVDTHYLQLYLWRFVSDENVVQFLLDEIVSSSMQRCLDPVTMEPSVVELICERS